MDYYQETFDTWNKIAKLYADVFMDLDIYNASYDKFCELLIGEQASVLEIGCGPGNITQYLFEKKPDISLLATDLAPNMIEIARQHNPQVEFQVLDCRNLSSLKRQFDAIVCGFTIPYLNPEDTSLFLSDCARLLTAKGIMYLSYVAGDSSQSGYQTGSSGDRTYFNYYPEEFIARQVRQNGFEITDHFEIPWRKRDGSQEFHTALILRKQK